MLKKIRLFLCRKFTIGLILFMISGNISAQAMDCDDLDLEKEYTLLKKLNRSKNNNKVILLADSLLAIISKNGKSTCKLRFQIEIEKGESLELQNKFQDAMNLYYNLIRNAEPLTYWDMVANAHISLARIQEHLDRYGDCLHHLKLANTLIQEHRLLKIESYYCVRYSSYLRLNGKDSARFYAQKAVELGLRDTNNKSISDGNLLLGILANEVDSSIFYYKKAIDAYLLDHDYRVAAEVANNIATKLLKVGRLTESMEQLAYAKLLIEQMPVNDELYYEVLSRIYKIKTTVFEKRNMIDSAYFYLKKSNENEEKSKWIIDKETVTNNAINFAIEKEQDKLKTSEKISRILKIGIGVMSVLILALGWSVFNNYSKRKKIATQNKKINTQVIELNKLVRQKQILLSELQHRVKNNLQHVLSLLDIQEESLAHNNIQEVIRESKNRVQSMALLHNKLSYSNANDSVNFEEYLHEMVALIQMAYFNPKKQINIQVNCNVKQLDIDTGIPLGLMMVELLSNSLKHAFIKKETGNILINITRDNQTGKRLLEYSDDGSGFDFKQPPRKGIGLELINGLLKEINATLNTKQENGTAFFIRF
ncbi:MAG: sensor histidine kinase [Ferruginibacter sp.]